MDDRTELRRLLSRSITPDMIRRGVDVDWRFHGDFDAQLYHTEPVVGHFVDEWEATVAAILQKHAWGMWIIDGPRGSGKTGFAVTVAFYFKHLFGRPVASNFPLKPAFGEYMTFTMDDIKGQIERLNHLEENAGTSDWQAVDLQSQGIWLPRRVILDDEFHRKMDKRRTMSNENKVLRDLVKEIRHYDITWLGLTPDKEHLDSKSVNNPLFMSTEARCLYEVDELTNRHYIRGILYQNEQITGSGWQRVQGPPDMIRVDVARFCNLWWTKGAISGSSKLSGRKKMELAGGGDDDWEDYDD